MGRICGPVNFGTIEITKEKAVGTVFDEFSEGTYEGCGIGEWRVGTTGMHELVLSGQCFLRVHMQ